MWFLSWMQGQENDRREGVCKGTEVCEGTASSLGAEDSGCSIECLGWSHDRCKMSHIDLVVQLDGELVDTEDQLQRA